MNRLKIEGIKLIRKTKEKRKNNFKKPLKKYSNINHTRQNLENVISKKIVINIKSTKTTTEGPVHKRKMNYHEMNNTVQNEPI